MSLQILRGIVENNNSPDKNGTVQVRIPGLHPQPTEDQDIFEVVKTEDLPWIEVISGGHLSGGVGTTQLPQIGAWVYVVVQDNLDEMFVIGSMKSGPKDLNSFSKGEGHSNVNHFDFDSEFPERGNGQAGSQEIDVAQKLNGRLGFISQHFESQGLGVHTISTGVGDQGGVSYGQFQLASNTGTMRAFINSPEAKDFKEDFGNLIPGNEQFNTVYERVQNERPEEFNLQQFYYIKRTHFDPVQEYQIQRGITINRRVQEQLFSQSVQHGFNGNKQIIDQFVKEMTGNGYSDSDIKKLYQQRGQYASKFASYNQTIGRYNREVNLVLDIPEDTPSWDGTTLFVQGSHGPQLRRTFTPGIQSFGQSSNSFGEGNVIIKEPEELDSKTVYPYSMSIQTQSGHFMIADDTEGNERLKFQHRSGQYFEFRPDGNLVIRSPSNEENFIILEGSLSEYVEGAVKKYIGGQLTSIFDGSVSTEFNKQLEIKVDEQLKATVGKIIEIDADENINIKTPKSINIEAGQAMNLKQGIININ